MPDPPYSREQYTKDFLTDKDLNESALARAHEIRKFEIDLYWKRATYFWTLIAATLVGFVAVQTSSVASSRTDMSVLLANLGIVFSFGWFCVNRGSKFWQENWEFHLDMLEDKIDGPLYKVVISRPDPEDRWEWVSRLLTGPKKFSVSKINQLISLFVTLMWVYLLLFESLPTLRFGPPFNWKYTVLNALTVVTCVVIWWLGKSSTGGYFRVATKRFRTIKNSASSDDA